MSYSLAILAVVLVTVLLAVTAMPDIVGYFRRRARQRRRDERHRREGDEPNS